MEKLKTKKFFFLIISGKVEQKRLSLMIKAITLARRFPNIYSLLV